MSENTGRSFVEKREGDTWFNAVLGAVVAYVVSVTVVGGVVASFVGGATAGYLQQGTRTEGAKVGAISGVVSAIPLVLGALVFLVFLAVGLLDVGARGLLGFGVAGVLAVLLFGAAFLYTVGLSAAGGYVGTILFERQEPTSEGSEGSEYESDAMGTTDVDAEEGAHDADLEGTGDDGSNRDGAGDTGPELEETSEVEGRSDSASRS